MNSLISSLAEKTVLPLLKKHLQWRARSVDGKLIDTKDFEGQGPDQDGKIALDVKIAGRDVEPLPVDEDGEEPSCEFPKLGEWEVYSDAVKERVTGFGGREY
jgi:tyrosinase